MCPALWVSPASNIAVGGSGVSFAEDGTELSSFGPGDSDWVFGHSFDTYPTDCSLSWGGPYAWMCSS